MIGHSKATKKEGGLASIQKCCVCCDETRDDSHIPKKTSCASDCESFHEGRENWFCYYKPTLTSNGMNQMKEKINCLEERRINPAHLVMDDEIAPNRMCFQ